MIFYFSGTGNTRWAAERLAEVTNEQLVYIPDVIKGSCEFNIRRDERIGFVFPVHGWRPPKLVRKFISKLDILWGHDEGNEQQPYVYAVCTAGDSIGKTIEFLAKDLQTTGLLLNAAFSLIMPESYVGLPFMDVDPKEKEERKKAKAREDLMRFRIVLRKLSGNRQALPRGGRPVHQMRKMCRGVSRSRHRGRKRVDAEMEASRKEQGARGKEQGGRTLPDLFHLLPPLPHSRH